jgi:Uma2 family endonuclease
MVSERIQATEAPHMTADEFAVWTANREQPGHTVELIHGEMITVPTNPLSSLLAMRIALALGGFARAQALGEVLGADAGLQVNETSVIAPDVSFLRLEKLGQLSFHGYGKVIPDLAVEVISPTDRQRDIRRKLALYAEIGTLVWVIYPERRLAEVYAPDAPVVIVPADGVLSAPELLPGFALALAEVFAAIP